VCDCSSEVKVTAPVEVATPQPTSAVAATGSRVVAARTRSTTPRAANGPKTKTGRPGDRTRRLGRDDGGHAEAGPVSSYTSSDWVTVWMTSPHCDTVRAAHSRR
jgi:hypothetical protein